jgi:hypothetical protein
MVRLCGILRIRLLPARLFPGAPDRRGESLIVRPYARKAVKSYLNRLDAPSFANQRILNYFVP